MKRVLRVPALEIKQSPKRKLYAFSVDGKLISEFATVSRVRRDDAGLSGYQRPEQLAHIDQIRTYIESESPLLPNAVVIAFDRRVKFQPTPGPSTGYSRSGELIIPIDPSVEEHERPGFIVDGQQRVAAIREAQVKSFPICATAFIAENVREQTEQFILVNSTKPLPKGLIYELLPSTDALLPIQLERRRLPAILVTRLNEDPSSPLYRSVKTATNPNGRIKDNSLLKVIENSLSDGVLFSFRARARNSDVIDAEEMFAVLCAFFSAVKEVFPDAWELPPKKSRLTHGAGVAALGFLMDNISHRLGLRTTPTKRHFKTDLQQISEVCHWTHGYWELGPGQQRRWDELQNTPKDVELLVSYLAAEYRMRVLGTPNGAGRRAPRSGT